jgi:phosphonate transport system permease protein
VTPWGWRRPPAPDVDKKARRGERIGLPALPWVAVLVVAAAFAAAAHLELRAADLFKGFGNLARLGEDAFPPQTALLPAAFRALGETLSMALLSTVAGFVIALPLGLAGARTLAPVWLFAPVRLLCAAIRSMPSLLWAVLFVILVGFGALAGVLAMTMYTVGHLAKLQYESLEGLPAEPFEAVAATGASRAQLARFVAVPDASNMLVSQLLYMFEYNIRASSIVGFVGAGGIGVLIQLYLSRMQYDGVATLIGLIFATVVVVDALSLQLRSRFLTSVPGSR